MAIFFNKKISLLDNQVSTTSWHLKSILLAVSIFNGNVGGSVKLFNKETEEIKESCVSKLCNAVILAWHPIKTILAIGWETGEVSIWNEQEKAKFEAPHLHNIDITCMCWSSNGFRLLTADSKGCVHIWKIDTKGSVQKSPFASLTVTNGVSAVLLKPLSSSEDTIDIAALAKAAVSGDERALDMLSMTHGKGIKFSNFGPLEANCFFVGCINGAVFYINDSAQNMICFETEGAVKRLLYDHEKNVLISVSDRGHITQHSILSDGFAREITRFKIACHSPTPEVIWAGKSLLAMAMGESLIRLWDLSTDDNYTLETENMLGYKSGSQLTSIAFSSRRKILAATNAVGQVAFWQFQLNCMKNSTSEPERQWQLQSACQLDVGALSHLEWGTCEELLGCADAKAGHVYVLSQSALSADYFEGVALVQTGSHSIQMGLFESNFHAEIQVDLAVHGVSTTKDLFSIWDGSKVIVYEYSISENKPMKQVGEFQSKSFFVALFEQNVFTVEPSKLQVRTPQGTVKQLVNLTDDEGNIVCMHINGKFLVYGTSKGCVRLYDLSRREAKPKGDVKMLRNFIPNLGNLVLVRCNAIGTLVSVSWSEATPSSETLQNESGTGVPVDSRLYIWDTESDRVEYFNFVTGRGEQDDLPESHIRTNMSEIERSKNEAALEIAGRYPFQHYWDASEPKLLVVEAVSCPPLDDKDKAMDNKIGRNLEKVVPKEQNDDTVVSEAKFEPETMIISIFATPDNGILMQDSFPQHSDHEHLIGVDAPYYYFSVRSDIAKRPILETTKEDQDDKNADSILSISLATSMSNSNGRVTGNRYVARRVMRDFVGLEEADAASKAAMMTFSFYITIGNMDEAFKAMKIIKSEGVWLNMAKMCVKTRRLDVAGVCLGKMNHARGAMMLREAREREQSNADMDSIVAVLAMQLDQNEEAERLLKQCRRFELLNEFYQAQGAWQKALDTAEHSDRIHLRATHFAYAKFLESRGDNKAALSHYVKSDTHRFEVPRMLFDSFEELEDFIKTNKDKALLRWWAQYMESVSDMQAALKFYEAAQDYLSLVRVYCFLDKVDKAAEICNDFGDRAACYHLARHYETAGDVIQAIHYFSRAQAISSALRLCRENHRDDHVYNLAMLGRRADMAETARYLEHKEGYQDKAVSLYHRAGQVSRAVDLAFRSKQFSALQAISSDLDDKTDPALLQRCANFFMENNQFDRAVDLLASGRQYREALKLCVEHNVIVDETLVEKLTPQKGDWDENQRIRLLEGIGDVCIDQGQYQLACKKFTQAGNRIKAMKALLKSGDAEKVIFFANVSKQKEIYVMAANFLQSLDWRRDPTIMKNIIQFYTRGRALDLLASFYEACAAVEMDEFVNYEKALGALTEAYKCLNKGRASGDVDTRILALQRRMELVQRFVAARHDYDSSPDEALKTCQMLLEEQNLDAALRPGHVYAFMVEHFVRKDKYKAAHACLDELQSRLGSRGNLTAFVPTATIESVYRALNLTYKPQHFGGLTNGKSNGSQLEDDDEVAEDIR